MCDQCAGIAEQQGKKLEQKTGWAMGTTANRETFVHCSMVTPDQVKVSGGLDPSKAREWVVPAESDHGDWRWHQFVFGFIYEKTNFPPKAARNLGFGEGGYVYLFTVPPGRAYMTASGTIMNNREVGFPDRIVLSDITGVFKYYGTTKGPDKQLEPLNWK